MSDEVELLARFRSAVQSAMPTSMSLDSVVWEHEPQTDSRWLKFIVQDDRLKKAFYGAVCLDSFEGESITRLADDAVAQFNFYVDSHLYSPQQHAQRILANVDNWYDPLYGVPPSSESFASAADQPGNPNVEQHVGPVADDYAAIRKRLDQIRAEKEIVKGHELPEPTPVTLKPWWR